MTILILVDLRVSIKHAFWRAGNTLIFVYNQSRIDKVQSTFLDIEKQNNLQKFPNIFTIIDRTRKKNPTCIAL